MLRYQGVRCSIERFRDDRGASLVEYALLVALVAVVCVGAISALGTATDAGLESATAGVASAGGDAGGDSGDGGAEADGGEAGDETPYPGCSVSPAFVTSYSGDASNGSCRWWDGSCGGTKYWNSNPEIDELESMYCA